MAGRPLGTEGMRVRQDLLDLLGGPAPEAGGRRRWLGLTVMLAALGTIEMGAVAFLGHAFLPPAASLARDIVGLVVVVGSCTATVSVVVRRHHVGGEDVHLVLGLLGAVRVPLAAVAEVIALPPLPAMEVDAIGPTIANGCLTLTAATGVPRVQLVLHRPVTGRRFLRRHDVTQVVASYQRESAGA